MQYWVSRDRVNPGVWITVFLVVITFINFLGVKVFGEIEFWMSILKVLTCLGLILLLWVIALGGGPTHERLGFRYWKNPGLLFIIPIPPKMWLLVVQKGFVAFVSVLVTAVFAYLGSELVAVTFSETRNPRRAIQKLSS